MARPRREGIADHAEPDAASLIVTDGSDVIGYVAIIWESNYAAFRRHGIPLVHQIAVAGPFRGATISPTAGAHAGVRSRSAKGCGSPSMMT
jgi:hypothetical protein